MNTTFLEAEVQFFKENAQRFAQKYPGKFLLVKGRKILGAFDSHDDAVSEGAKRFPPGSEFLVRSALDPDDPVFDNVKLIHGIPLTCPS